MDKAAAAAASDTFNSRAQRADWPCVCDPTLSFSHPELRDLHSVWLGLPRPSGLPSRKDILPRNLKPHLPDIAIYERCAENNRYRVKLTGTAFTETLGELSGRWLDEAVPPEVLPRWQASLDTTLEAGTALRFLSRSDTRGRGYLVGEYFAAPLLSDDGKATTVLAAGRFAAQSWSEVLATEKGRTGERVRVKA